MDDIRISRASCFYESGPVWKLIVGLAMHKPAKCRVQIGICFFDCFKAFLRHTGNDDWLVHDFDGGKTLGDRKLGPVVHERPRTLLQSMSPEEAPDFTIPFIREKERNRFKELWKINYKAYVLQLVTSVSMTEEVEEEKGSSTEVRTTVQYRI